VSAAHPVSVKYVSDANKISHTGVGYKFGALTFHETS